MKVPFYIIVDVSGSMSESGKYMIARGLARATEQYLRLGYACADLNIVAWNDTVRVFDWCPDEEFPLEMLVSEGAANAQALLSFLGKQPDGRVLLLTDGAWSQADSKALIRWKKGLQANTIRLIMVGADANPQLRGSDVFTAEDLFAALDGWLEGVMA